MNQQTFVIDKGKELRLEVPFDKTAQITLVQGSAEIFGSTMRVGRKYSLKGQKVAIFTYDGASVELEGHYEGAYIGEETPMSFYLNVHWLLEQRRREAQTAGGPGPRVMVVGPTDTGKSTVCRILLNYAVRSENGHKPAFIDLDVGQGTVSVPGCVSAVAMEEPIDVEEGSFAEAPIVFYYGHATPSENLEHYKACVDRLAAVVNKRAADSREAESSGMVVNTMGWIDGAGYELLLHHIDAFNVNVVLVMGQDKLHALLLTHCSKLQQEKGRHIDVVKLPKSGGVVDRDPQFRREARNRRIQEYFYGARGDYQPVASTVALSSLQLYRIGGAKAPTSALPIGAQALFNPLKIAPATIGLDTENTLVGVSHAPAPEDALNYCVAGFVLMKNVDLRNQTASLLAPNNAPFPGEVMIAGTIKANSAGWA